MSYQPATEFKRKAVEPVACIKTGWNLIKSDYWLFVGITFVGILVGGVVPLILVGPMMCGIFLTLFRKMRGEPVEFGTVFQGFEYFGPSLIATFLHMIPVFAILVPCYIAMFMAPFLLALTAQQGEPNPVVAILVVVIIVFLLALMMVLLILVNIAFTFVYPLIVDRKMQGFDAVKLSAKAGLANGWQLLGLGLLCGLMGMCGALLCYVGLFFVLPITFAALAVAYNQVFGLGNVQTNMPPPPPVFR